MDASLRKFTRELVALLHPHYIVNILLASSFFILKNVKPFCTYLYNSQCELDWREWEISMFVAVVVIFKSRKAGATSMLAYLSSGFMYLKIGNAILFFNSNPTMGIVFSVLCVLQLFLFPEPMYTGPENIIYFRGPNLNDEMSRDRRVVWMIAFYAAWSPACAAFAPTFAELSSEYSLDNLKFGKLDVTRYPEVAKAFYVNDSPFSKQLPTVALFREGKEEMRRPLVDSKGRLQKFFFSVENLKLAFDLDNLYVECKSNLQKRDKKAKTASESGTSHAKSE